MSKSLSSTQSNYSNIEQEALTLVFGVTKFHTDLFGSLFCIVTDHKPLATILKKLLTSCSTMTPEIASSARYQFDLEYKPSSTEVIGDALSRLPNPADHDVPFDIVHSVKQQMATQQLDLTYFGAANQDALQQEMARDPVFKEAKKYIFAGWPESIKDLSRDILVVQG